MNEDLHALKDLVCRAADDELMGRFLHSNVGLKKDGSVVTDADLAIDRRLRSELQQRFPDFGFLSEEMSPHDQERQLASCADTGLWILDPLDGTTNFANGLPYFCVSLALVQNGNVRWGLVYDPIHKECFIAEEGAGAWLNDQRLGQQRPSGPLRKGIGIVDYKRLPDGLGTRLLSSPPFASQRNLGSVALEMCWLAAGRGHVYLHGRHKLWDYAAGLLVIEQAGGRTTTLEGEPSPGLRMAPRSTAAALDAELFREWCAWLRI